MLAFDNLRMTRSAEEQRHKNAHKPRKQRLGLKDCIMKTASMNRVRFHNSSFILCYPTTSTFNYELDHPSLRMNLKMKTTSKHGGNSFRRMYNKKQQHT